MDLANATVFVGGKTVIPFNSLKHQRSPGRTEGGMGIPINPILLINRILINRMLIINHHPHHQPHSPNTALPSGLRAVTPRKSTPFFNYSMRIISGTLKSTPLNWLPVLANIAPPDLRRKAKTLREYILTEDNPDLPIHTGLDNLPRLRIKSRKPFWITQATWTTHSLTRKQLGAVCGKKWITPTRTWCWTNE